VTDAKYIIRTSDRGQFRKCRVKWDFGSKIRRGYDYAPGIHALDFGVAVHAGLEVYYDPETWDWLQDDRRETVHALTLSAFTLEVNKQMKRVRDTGNWSEEQSAKFDDDLILGIKMLEHYFAWAPRADKGLRPVKSEIEFEVPVPATPELLEGLRADPARWSAIEDKLWFLGPDGLAPVVYQGRIDVVMLDEETDKYWIMDHKTAAQFGQQEHLSRDPQCGSYMWALMWVLGIQTEGVIYSELRKKAPSNPKRLQNGGFSQNKGQSTTWEWYAHYLKKNGINVEPYKPFLRTLREVQQEYFRREKVFRSQHEMHHVGMHILMEAIDMLDDPFIYPNPDRWNCNGCAFAQPCTMRLDGSDWQWHLDNSGLYIRNNA
jgi:hypothetical protein